ncbi:MAG: phenylalanine--tRNA ligase subunit beta, partial [Traorella sp.]
YVRNSILPSMLEALNYNLNRNAKDLTLFEMSKVYGVHQEQQHLGIVMNGSLQKSRVHKIDIKADFYVLKGIVETILSKFGFEGTRIKFKENTTDIVRFHPYASAEVYLGKELFAIFGIIHPTMAKKYDVTKDTMILEANLEVLLSNKASKVKFEGISKYPSVTRDLAFVVKKDVKVGDIVDQIKRCGKIIKSVEVFDIYTGEHVASDSKSIALSVVFQSNDKTLTDQEINDVFEKILVTLKKGCNAELRG